MKNNLLQPSEIRELILHYQAELRKLEYQLVKTQTTLQELEELASKKAKEISDKKSKPIDNQPIIPKEKESTPQEKRGRGRPKKQAITTEIPTEKPVAAQDTKVVAPTDPTEKKRSRSLSEWDELVVSYLTNKSKIAIAAEFYAFVIEKNEQENLALPVEEVKERISRSLHKLANKRGDLVKIKRSEGRGYGYALPQWINAKGTVKQKYSID